MNKNLLKTISYFFFIYIILGSVYLVFNKPQSLFYDLGRLFGLLSIGFLFLIIFIGDIARYLDQYFGLDKIIKFNRKFGLVILIATLLHPIFFMINSNKIIPYLVPNFNMIGTALGITALYLLIVFSISSILYKKISYKAWQYLHFIEYLIFGFGIYHAIRLGSDVNQFIEINFYVMIALILIGTIYRLNYKIKQKSQFEVLKVEKESDNVFSLYLKSPKINFKPGQWFFLRLKGFHARHPFSIINHPKDKYLKFTIKKYGKFTEALSKLKAGDVVFIEGPFGIFLKPEKPALFIAGGIGITPFVNMFDKKDTLLYFAKEFIYKKELNKGKVYFFQNQLISEELLNKFVKDITERIVYICGPDKMRIECVKILKRMGIKKKNIKYESFFW